MGASIGRLTQIPDPCAEQAVAGLEPVIEKAEWTIRREGGQRNDRGETGNRFGSPRPARSY